VKKCLSVVLIVFFLNFASNFFASEPTCVTELTATPGNKKVTLNWIKPEGTVAGYVVLQSTDASKQPYASWNAIECTSEPDTTTYTATGLKNGTTYYFFLVACESITCNPGEPLCFLPSFYCVENPVVVSATPRSSKRKMYCCSKKSISYKKWKKAFACMLQNCCCKKQTKVVTTAG